MRILIHGGVHPYKQASWMEITARAEECGKNIGNMMFINAVAASVDLNNQTHFIPTMYRSVFLDEEIEWINSECDYFLLPLADAFRSNNKALKNLADTIKKLRIPCIVVGVGLRAPIDYCTERRHTYKFDFDEEVKDFMNAVLDKSTIVGVRGENTGIYLNDLGYKEDVDYRVIGCPSMCIYPIVKREQRGFELTKDIKIGINANDLAPNYVNKFIINMVKEYSNSVIVQQREQEISEVYLSYYSKYRKDLFRIKGSLYGEELYAMLKEQGRIKCFSNIQSWVEYLSGLDLCVNNRFHGTVASLYAGTKTVVIPLDSRMNELVEYHKLPSISMRDIFEGNQLEELLDKVDFFSHEGVAYKNMQRYFEFLEDNGLEHIDTTNCNLYGKAEIFKEEKDFTHINMFEKACRLLVYEVVCKKARNKKKKSVWEY